MTFVENPLAFYNDKLCSVCDRPVSCTAQVRSRHWCFDSPNNALSSYKRGSHCPANSIRGGFPHVGTARHGHVQPARVRPNRAVEDRHCHPGREGFLLHYFMKNIFCFDPKYNITPKVHFFKKYRFDSFI